MKNSECLKMTESIPDRLRRLAYEIEEEERFYSAEAITDRIWAKVLLINEKGKTQGMPATQEFTRSARLGG